MSKQSEAKERQGYVAKAIPQTCMNCANYKSEFIEHKREWTSQTWVQETNMRCGIGEFAVKKSGTCNEWAAK